MHKRLNILVIEAYTDANIGSGALVENTIMLLRRRYPNAHLRVMAHNPQVFATLCQVEAVPDIFHYPFGQGRARQVMWLLSTLLWMVVVYIQACLLRPDKWPFLRGKVQDFLWADWVVSVGAERINDKFVKNILFSLYTYALVNKLGRKMILFPCTIGPFLFRWTKGLAGRVLRHLDLIYTRDDLSHTITCGLAGVPAERVVNTSDVAVFQQQNDRVKSLAMLGVSESQPIVGISVMRWTYVANKVETPYSNYNSYVGEMSRLADLLIERYGVLVVFYPTNFPVHGCREDDVSTALEIQCQMKHGSKTKVIRDLPTPSVFKGMLACSEVNITTRMHACILSTGAGVPTISVNYLFKLSEYMNSLGLAEFSIDIEEFCGERALAAFERMWHERPQWRATIEQAIAAKQRQLLNSFELMDQFIDSSAAERSLPVSV